jgi:hypothetical protein
LAESIEGHEKSVAADETFEVGAKAAAAVDGGFEIETEADSSRVYN